MTQTEDSRRDTPLGDTARDGRMDPVQIQHLREAKDFVERLIQSQKMQAVGALAGGIAHDLNNLLTAINGYSELALGRLGADDALRPTIEEIRGAGERAAVLTRQLLVFSRRQELQMQVLDLNGVIEGLRGMLQRLLGEGIELITRLAPDLAGTEADPGQIQQVIVNLSVNARDAMPGKGTLTIETSNVEMTRSTGREFPGMAPGSYVMFSLSDTGSGVPPEVQAHLFEPFFTTRKVDQGTGLGLFTVYCIVRQSGGHIHFTSTIGQGTTFQIYLPRVE